jgi:hypothetical protein
VVGSSVFSGAAFGSALTNFPRTSFSGRRTVWSKMKILDAPVLFSWSASETEEGCRIVRLLQELLNLRIIDSFNVVII